MQRGGDRIPHRGSRGRKARIPIVSHRTLWLLFALVLVYGGCYWGVASWSGSGEPRRVVWSGEIRFKLPQVIDSRYPNGRPFCPNDLTSSMLLQRVVERLDLEMDVDELAGMVAVYSPGQQVEDLVEEIDERMSGATTAGEIDQLQQEFLERWRFLASSQVRLGLIATNPDLPGEPILRTIPEVWSEYARKEAALLDRFPRTLSGRAVEELLGGDLDPILRYFCLQEILGEVEADAVRLQEAVEGGPDRLVTSNGETLGDIRIRAKRVREVDLEIAVEAMADRGLEAMGARALTAMRARISDLRRRARYQADLAQLIRSTVDSTSENASPAPEAKSSQRTLESRDLLSRLLLIGEEAIEGPYRQARSREELGHRLESAGLEAEASRLEQLREVVEGRQRRDDGSSEERMVEIDRTANADELASIQPRVLALLKGIEEIRESVDGTVGDTETGSSNLYVWISDIDRRNLSPWSLRRRIESFAAGLVVVLFCVGSLFAVKRTVGAFGGEDGASTRSAAGESRDGGGSVVRAADSEVVR